MEHTSLVVTELHVAGFLELVRVHFGIKTMTFFEDASEHASACVDITPVRHGLDSVDFWHDIVERPFAERLEWSTL